MYGEKYMEWKEAQELIARYAVHKAEWINWFKLNHEVDTKLLANRYAMDSQ